MYFFRKLRPDRSITGLLPAIVVLASFLFTLMTLGLESALAVVSIQFLAMVPLAVVAWVRTQNVGYLLTSLYLFSMTLYFATVPRGLLPAESRRVPAFFLSCAIAFAVPMAFQFFAKRYKWRGREVLELAAMPVDETSDGFASRPLPVGRTDASRREVLAFADFCRRNLIAMPYVEKNGAVLVPVKMGEEYGHLFRWNRDYRSDTWVELDFEGNVSAHISERDYEDYEDRLAFDQLCHSLGRLFIEFLEWFRASKRHRIIDRMNALQLSAFS